MHKITLNGESFESVDDIKGFIRRWRESLFEYFTGGMVHCIFLNPEKEIFTPLIDKLREDSSLDNNEKMLLTGMINLQEHLRSFDRKRYKSLGQNEKVIYALRFGKQCAELFESLVEDSIRNFDLRNRMLYYYPYVVDKDGKRKEYHLENNPLYKKKN